MIQEIITYLIIGIAISIAGYKIVMKFRKVKKTSAKQKGATNTEHKCADCAADCMLRNSVKPIEGNDRTYCKKTEITEV